MRRIVSTVILFSLQKNYCKKNSSSSRDSFWDSLNTSEVRYTELKAFIGFDEITRMHKIQKHLSTTVACDFHIYGTVQKK